MNSWHLLVTLGVPAIGVLAFLRVTTNEIDSADREVKAKREAGLALQSALEIEEIVAEPAV